MTEQLSTENNTVTFDNREHAEQLALELIQQAQQEICFFGPLIDPVLLDNDAIIEQMSAFARHSARGKIRIVVFDTRKNIAQSHRLIPLAQRLTSKIEIRIAKQEHQKLGSMYLLIDGNAYLYCPNAERYQGRADKHAPAAVRDMQQSFDDIWNHAKQDINTRRLHL